jgi:L,D-transpeptidase catalytic domain
MNKFVQRIFLAVMLIPTIDLSYRSPSLVFAGETKKTTITCNDCLRLVQDDTGRTNNLGNPIYKLEAFSNGQKVYSFDAITGRDYTQNRNRHKSGTEAPLPDGNYTIASKIVPGSIPEVGETFIPIYPKFKTGRSALGIHYDPSFNKNNREDGTSGCIALTNKVDRDAINYFVTLYKPQLLIVDIQ